MLPVFVVDALSINISWLDLLRSMKAKGRDPKNCLGQVFNFNLGCFWYMCNCMAKALVPKSRVENVAQVSSC